MNTGYFRCVWNSRTCRHSQVNGDMVQHPACICGGWYAEVDPSTGAFFGSVAQHEEIDPPPVVLRRGLSDDGDNSQRRREVSAIRAQTKSKLRAIAERNAK